MALSFMPQADIKGTVCYVVYGSHPSDLVQAQDFQTVVHEQYPGQVVLIDHNSSEAHSLLEFFSIVDHRFPVSLIVREDDSLAYESTNFLPTIDDINYRLSQIGN